MVRLFSRRDLSRILNVLVVAVSEVCPLLASLTLRPNTQHPIKSLAFHEA